MTDEHPNELALIQLLHDKRVSLDRYVARSAPQRRSLLNITIIAGALATLLTALPAVGGKTFVEMLKAAVGLSRPPGSCCALPRPCAPAWRRSPIKCSSPAISRNGS